MTADSDRVASDQTIAEFVRTHLVCHCGSAPAVLYTNKTQSGWGICDKHITLPVAGHSEHAIRIRPKPRKIATPEEAWQALRHAGIVALRPMVGLTQGYKMPVEAIEAEKQGAELLWLVDPEEIP